MDAERALISKAIHTGQIEKLITIGVDDVHFVEDDNKNVWRFCVNHVRKYKTPPSFDTVKEKFDGFSFVTTTDSLEFITDKFIRNVKRIAVTNACRDIAGLIDDDQIDDIDTTFLEKAREVTQGIPSTARVARFSDMMSRISQYRDRVEEGTAQGIPMGIPQFDALTFGIQSHEFISIVGWQGTGKSTLLQWIFFNAYLAGATPMLISLEMESENLYRKWDTMAVNFEYMALKAAELDEGSINKWEQFAEKAAQAKNDIIVIDDLSKCTVETIYAETVKYKPDIVGIDYISLMQAPRSYGALWEKVTYLSQGLKQNARSLKIPVYGVAQTNIASADDGAKLENIAYSRSIGQDSDIILGLNQSDEMRNQKQMEVRMLKNRDGSRTTSKIFWDMDRMNFRQWNPEDIFPKKQGEADGQDKEQGREVSKAQKRA